MVQSDTFYKNLKHIEHTGFGNGRPSFLISVTIAGHGNPFALRLFSHLWGYGWEQGRATAVAMIRQAVEHHKRQGLDFVEYRAGFWGEAANLREKMQICNEANPEQRLTAVYHVGESYFDKSVESAVRWCHEAALLGAKRLGHCIALGLDPAVAVSRRPQAHEAELVSERLDQIAYDLRFVRQLRQAGITIDAEALQIEQQSLASLAVDDWVERPYTPQRFQEIRQRQTFVLDQLTQASLLARVFRWAAPVFRWILRLLRRRPLPPHLHSRKQFRSITKIILSK